MSTLPAMHDQLEPVDSPTPRRRFFCYFLLAAVAPGIIFLWPIVFGAQAYQEWNDRFTYELTNRYLFAQVHVGTVLGPQWREDILSGSVWATNKAPTPFSVQMIAARLYDLSPVWLELVGNVVLYLSAALSMYLYLRRVLRLGIESATVTAVMFAATAFWLSCWVGNPDLPMPAAWIPALLLLAHQIARAVKQRHAVGIALTTIALGLALYVCAIHSVLASLPAAPMIVVTYAWLVLRPAVLWVAVGLGLGLLLYSPFLWSVVEATRLSSRYVGVGFLGAQDLPFDPGRWLTTVRMMLTQAAVGHNQYGLYLVAVVAVVTWWSLKGSWRDEPPHLQAILKSAALASGAFILLSIFDVTIDYLKIWMPFVGAWHVRRFEHFLFVPFLILVGWMLDRALFHHGTGAHSGKKGGSFRTALIVVAGIAVLQVGYSAVRMRVVPASIYPQNIVLFASLALYAVAVATLLGLLYRASSAGTGAGGLRLTEGARLACVTLIVLSVTLAVSIHSYRGAVLPPKIGIAGKADPLMTYAERYAIPPDLAVIKEMNGSNARVVDLTRPWYADTLGPASETTLVPLAGLQTPSGYNFAPTRWYEKFVTQGINGTASELKYIIQIRSDARTNFEALGLLNVGYILAESGTRLPGYVPVRTLESEQKTIYAPVDDTLVSRAFLSSGAICFASDDEALAYIRTRSLRDLRTRVVLVSGDAGSETVCKPNRGQPKALLRSVPVRSGGDRVFMEIDTSSEAVLTLSDSYYPGWKVLVDGVEKPLLRTYTALRGVAVEPGRHLIEFTYQPRTFGLLYWLSNGLLLLLLGASILGWHLQRVQPGPQGTLEAAR